MQRAFLSALLVSVALAGCIIGEDDASGAFHIALVDDAPVATSVTFQGAWIHQAGNGSWISVAPEGAMLNLTGSGEEVAASASVPAGPYDALRVVLSRVEVDGTVATFSETGFELPAAFEVTEDGETRFVLHIGWGDAVFESSAGLSFHPTLRELAVLVDAVEVLRLLAQEIDAGPTKAPVARMRVFESSGFPIFTSDFVAESPADPVIGRSGSLTASAAESEAVAVGADIAAYRWMLDGALVGEAKTVSLDLPLAGGNFTLRLEVEDSLGSVDAQTVKMALAPGLGTMAFNFTGSIMGLEVTDPLVYQDGDSTQMFMIDAESFDGSPARVAAVTGTMSVVEATFGLGNDVDFEVLDGEGRFVGGGTTSSNEEAFSKEYPPGSNPASGDWTYHVVAVSSMGSDYEGAVTVTFEGINPGMELFLASYDDGHTHCHPGIDEC